MYRNTYDTDCITWSPQGRIFQIEYAMNAVTQGTCVLGLRSETHVVTCALRRTVSKLASHNQKAYKIDGHIGLVMSGITADARVISNFMRGECLHHKFVYDSPIPVGRLVKMISDKSQVNTQRYSKRPYGVGLLVAGYDSSGSHLFETCPSGNYLEYHAMALGARSQSSKTYLEKHFESFRDASVKQLVNHGLKALRAAIPQDQELTADNVAIGIVGKETPWLEYPRDEVKVSLDYLAETAPQVVEDVTMEDVPE